MLSAFTRLTDRLLAHLGEEAVLRNEVVDPPRKVNIEHGVELVGTYGDTVVVRTVATIATAHSPEVGNTLDMVDEDGAVVKRYVLDTVVNDNGCSIRFALRDA